ncbi:GNAT family N-acetyltransferase [Candidatus Woesearchaeota archaeon]|nr:GNAT family N-acetyltransferase [Candidatus Woesearchaeota archaeon]
MPLDLALRTIHDERELRGLRTFLLGQALWYPDYANWVEGVCIPDLDHGYKCAIVAYSNGHVVGDVIWQPHKELPRTRELKNLRIHPGWRGRDLGHFLIRQAEEEGKGSFDRIIGDVDSRQTGVLRFLSFCGYRPILQLPLYCDHNLDIVVAKEFPHTDPYRVVTA